MARYELTERELEVVAVIQEGARSMAQIAKAMDPPVSKRTVQAHVYRIALKIPADHEPDATTFLRVMLWSLHTAPEAEPLTDQSE